MKAGWGGVGGLVLVLVLAGLRAQAHVGDNYQSVHFHSGMVDFGSVPRRGRLIGEHDDRHVYNWGMDEAERSGIELTQDGDAHREEVRDHARRRIAADAEWAVQAGNWAGARRAWARMAHRLGPTGEVLDRLQVLDRVLAIRGGLDPAFARALRRHLGGLGNVEKAKLREAQTAFVAVARDPASGFLREHALYQQACLAWAWWDYRGAAQQLRQLLADYPKTVKRECALMMLARCTILPRTAESRQLDIGRQALGDLGRDYPKTRFRRSMAGLRARLAFLDGRPYAAIEQYFALDDLESVEIVRRTLPKEQQSPIRVRLLARYLLRVPRATDYDGYYFSLKAVARARERLTAAEAYRFSQLLVRRPDVASPYFYYRLYHTDNKPADLRRLVQLAEAVAARQGASRLAPGVQTRLAEVYYQRGAYGRSVEWADRALRGGRTDRALYVRGASFQKLGKYAPALADFTALLRSYSNSPLRRGAREMAAIVCELMGDLSGALDQYFELRYAGDIAFLLDIRMSIPQIEAMLRSHRGLDRHYDQARWPYDQWTPMPARVTRRILVRYSLGFRYLRENRFDEAERLLRGAPREFYAHLQDYGLGQPLTTEADTLVAVRKLRSLRRAIDQARGDEAKAAALYRYASYIYKGSDLLFYNAALWQGWRAGSFAFCWNKHHATHQDDLAARDHHYRHEIYARAEDACLEIARHYPNTRVAPQALYRAACCERKLSNFNYWWRRDCKRVNHGKLAARYMRRMAARYPRSPLAHAARKYAVVFANEASNGYYDW